MYDLVVCVVTNNHIKYIDKCLNSIYAHPSDLKLRIVVVDNHSHDGSAEFIRDHHPKIELVKQNRSFSFSKNNNLGFSRYDSRYFLMLNPDTVLLDDVFAKLLEFMDDHPDAAACGPMLFNPDGSLQYSCRRFPTFLATIARRTPIRSVVSSTRIVGSHLLTHMSHDIETKVDWILGACLMVRREAIRGSRLLDENFPLYCEEIDLCYRLNRAGWAVYYTPTTRLMHHFLNESYKRLISRANMKHMRSMLYFLIKHRLYGRSKISFHPGVKTYSSTNHSPGYQ